VKVNVICPGYVLTRMTAQDGISAGLRNTG